MKDLRARGLLDDVCFAKEVIESTLARKPVGRRFLAAKLQRFLVPRGISEDALAECLPRNREAVLARAAFEKKLLELRRRHGGDSPPDVPRAAALYRFLLARGFSPDIVQGVIDEAL